LNQASRENPLFFISILKLRYLLVNNKHPLLARALPKEGRETLYFAALEGYKEKK
jgi:hypothetical protein